MTSASRSTVSQLIMAKCSAPRLGTAVQIERNLPITENCQLVVISAPAGYGKTTLMAQWNQHWQGAVAWLQLDEEDNCEWRFFRYLTQSLICADPALLSTSFRQWVFDTPTVDASSFVPRLITELALYQHPLLVLIDNQHVINRASLIDAMCRLIKYLSPNITLVLATRHHQKLPLAQLMVEHRAILIDKQQLCFNLPQLALFARENGQIELSKGEATDLLQRTKGWPAAILLTLGGATGQRGTSKHNALTLKHALHNYLISEITSALPQELLHFLNITAVANPVTDELCKILMPESDVTALLNLAVQYNLLSALPEGEAGEYEMHPLTADFLRQRLAQSGVTIHRLYLQIGNYHLQRRQYQQAANHALSAKDVSLMCEVVTKGGWSLLQAGERSSLTQLFNAIPEEILLIDPQATLIRIWYELAIDRNIGQALRLIINCESRTQSSLPAPLAHQLTSLRCYCQSMQGNDSVATATLVRLTLEQLKEHEHSSHAILLSAQCQLARIQGDYQAALSAARSAEVSCRMSDNNQQLMWLLLTQNYIAVDQGNFQLAEEKQQQMLHLISQHKGQLLLRDQLYRSRAYLLYQQMLLNDATHFSLQARACLAENYYWQLMTNVTLLRIKLLQNNIPAARVLMLENKTLLQQQEYCATTRLDAEDAQISYWIAANQWDELICWHSLNEPINSFSSLHSLQQGLSYLRVSLVLISMDKLTQASLPSLLVMARAMQETADQKGYLIYQIKLRLWLSIALMLKGLAIPASQKMQQTLSLAAPQKLYAVFFELRKQLPALLALLEGANLEPPIELFCQQLGKAANTFEAEAPIPNAAKATGITQREWQVLLKIEAGISNERIATEIFISANTLKTHIRNLYKKIKVSNREEAIEQLKILRG